jgi:hypothetical protein
MLLLRMERRVLVLLVTSTSWIWSEGATFPRYIAKDSRVAAHQGVFSV